MDKREVVLSGCRATGRKSERQQGITGLETAIVLIAFVVVASVFAFTILSAGVFSSEANKQTIHAGLAEARTRLRQQGSAFALSARVGSTEVVQGLVFIVANTLAGEPVDLTPPYTADGTDIDPDFDPAASPATIVSYSDENQRLPAVPWTVRFIGSHNGDLLLEDGEKAEMTVWVMDRDTTLAATADDSALYQDTDTGNGGGSGGIESTGTVITKSTRFIVEITPQIGAPLTLQRTIPPGLRQVMNLN